MINDFLHFIAHLAKDSSGEFLSALAGAFAGAVCAFMLERRRDKTKQRDDQHGAIVRSQLALLAQLNIVNNIKKQYLDPLKEDKDRAKKLINVRMEDTPLRVQYDSLAFLLMTDDPTMVLDIHAAEATYTSAMGCLAWRNEAYVKMHDNSIFQETKPDTNVVKIALKDPRHLMQVTDLTNHLYTVVDNAIERLKKESDKMHTVGKKLFPKRRFLQVDGEK